MKKNNIRVKLKSEVGSKLAFVKLIKECTNLGLKDAKWTCDTLHENLRKGLDKSTDIELIGGVDGLGNSYLKVFQQGILDIGVNAFVNGGVAWERNFKMLSIGIGEKKDYSDFIFEYVNTVDLEHGKDIINLLIDKLSQNDLEEIFEIISKEIKI